MSGAGDPLFDQNLTVAARTVDGGPLQAFYSIQKMVFDVLGLKGIIFCTEVDAHVVQRPQNFRRWNCFVARYGDGPYVVWQDKDGEKGRQNG